MKIDIDLIKKGRYPQRCIMCDVRISSKKNYCYSCQQVQEGEE